MRVGSVTWRRRNAKACFLTALSGRVYVGSVRRTVFPDARPPRTTPRERPVARRRRARAGSQGPGPGGTPKAVLSGSADPSGSLPALLFTVRPAARYGDESIRIEPLIVSNLAKGDHGPRPEALPLPSRRPGHLPEIAPGIIDGRHGHRQPTCRVCRNGTVLLVRPSDTTKGLGWSPKEPLTRLMRRATTTMGDST